ncbi:MAG: ABC transporter ATP-binding protein [Oscillospiraceae bacterium]
MKILDISGLSLSYQSPRGELTALKNISFSVDEGEFVSIIGPSGCGKSTLLSIVAGLLSPTDGTVTLNTGESTRAVGYMLQSDCLFPWRTIGENIYLGLELMGIKDEKNTEYADKLLKQYGLWDFYKSYPSELSGGMRQRAALIRTLAVMPRVLLLDEPFSALDYQTRLAVNDDIYKIIKNEKKTAVMVSHDISEAISMSDRVIVLTHRPAEIKTSYDIVFKEGRGSPLLCREKEEFKVYFNHIWRDIDVHV